VTNSSQRSLRRQQCQEHQTEVADLDFVAVGEHGAVHPLTVDIRAVEAARVDDAEFAVFKSKLGVVAADSYVVEEDVAARMAARGRSGLVKHELGANVGAAFDNHEGRAAWQPFEFRRRAFGTGWGRRMQFGQVLGPESGGGFGSDVLRAVASVLVSLGHSGGGRWALWYAMAHPGRVKRLVLIGVPGLPETRCPLPIRLIAIPGMGELLSRLVPPSPKSVLRFASFVGEKATLAAHPDLVDLMVATGRDPIAAASARAEIRVLVAPFTLLSPSGFRRHSSVQPDELRQLAMATLVVWGEQDPLGTVSVVQAVTKLIPHARLKALPTGHAPWLGQPAQTAATVADFVR